jgi:vitamin B12 transporter
LPSPSRDSDRDGYRNRSVSAHAKYRYAPDQSLGISAFHSDGKTEFDDLFETNNSSRPKLTVGSLSFENRIVAAWKSRVQLGASIDDSKFFNADIFTSRFRTTNNKLEWQNDVQVSDGHKIILGLDYLRQRVAYNDGFEAIDKSRRSAAAFFGYVANFAGGHHLQGNLRHDRYSDVGGRTTGLLGGGYALTDRFTLTAMVSTAFRAPTFVDLYYPAPFGNPDLKPERAQSVELGIQYAGVYGLGKAVYFRNRLKDLIGPASGVLFPVNINRAKSNGLELSYDGTFGDTTLRASATAQNAVDENSGEPLLRRAKRFASINVAHQLGNWNIGGEIIASGPKQDIRVDDFFTKVRVPGYTILNLKSTYNVGKHTRIVGRLENLLNKKYQLVHGYNREERSAYLDLTHEF